jgi:glycosyltransferase involved in cell wall biosynthesis
MKVLMTTDAVGGVFTYCVQLAASLAPLGVGVLLASMGRRLSVEQRAQAERVGATLVESEYRLEWMDDPWDDVERAGDWLLGIERRVAPDLIHVNGYAHAALPWAAPALTVAHSCVCSWWRAVLRESAPDRYDRYRAKVALGLGAARAIVAPTASMLRCLGEEYGTSGRGRVIHNGIQLGSMPQQPKAPFVLAAGRVWDRAKNIIQLERAAREIAWPIYVAGDSTGPDGRETPAFEGVRSLGLLPREELGHWMARASIFALPARYEPFGLSILEAAAAGCALVLGDIPSLRELWGDAALFVDPDDAVALSRELSELTRDPGRRARLGAAAHQRAERYGAALMGQRYLDLYRSLCTASEARERIPELAVQEESTP